MVEAGTIITLIFTIIIITVIGLQIYKRKTGRFGGQPSMGGFKKPYRASRTTPEGEPLEGYSNDGFSFPFLKIIIPAVIGLIIVGVLISSSVKIVDAGFRGVLLNFGAVNKDASLKEGIHFVVPFRDSVVQMETRTLKVVEDATSASKDLQGVSTQVAVNYRLSPESVPVIYQQLGYQFETRVVSPAIQESVKQITARFNAEELITQREIVKNQIQEQIKTRLALYNIEVETVSITEFRFSEEFAKSVELKVTAQQRALQAQNDLRRIQIEANQTEAKAIGEQKANIAQAKGTQEANVLRAQGEAEAIKIIDTQLRSSPSYLEWLKTQKWDGQLPLVTGGGEGVTPFIEIPVENIKRTVQNNTVLR